MMKKTRILLVGNHTCANRGDGAILRGILCTLEENFPDAELTTLSRFPKASSYLLGKDVIQDPLVVKPYSSARAKVQALKQFFGDRLMPSILCAHLEQHPILKHVPLPTHYQAYLDLIKNYDLVIQVGGSFFVDLYGDKQFEHPLLAIFANKPTLLLGHSVGPFSRKSFSRIARVVFNRVNGTLIRESISLEEIQKLKIKDSAPVRLASDTAWLVNTSADKECQRLAVERYCPKGQKRIAITVRDLAPFDKRLGVTQKGYEQQFVHLCERLIEKGYHIIAVSMCTGLDGYHKDDRMVALDIQKELKQPSKMTVVMDELNDIEIGALLGECELTIGTRLHNTIISMRFGTPAIAVYYEHKSKGVMDALGYSERSVQIPQMMSDETWHVIDQVLDNQSDTRKELKQKVELLSQSTSSAIVDMVSSTLYSQK